jgi:hypothetical protein
MAYRSSFEELPVPNLNKRLWKLKAPLKMKIFRWYLRHGVILTKDNLMKQNWNGSMKCCFCHNDETFKHIFLECQVARITWNIVHVPTNLYPLNMFGSWLRGINKVLKPLALLGATSICWTTGSDLEAGKWSGCTGPPILEGPLSSIHIYILRAPKGGE